MSLSTQQALEEINQVSRQLLSCILDVQNTLSENGIVKDAPTSPAQESPLDHKDITEHDLIDLMSERENLIHALFNQNSNDEISKNPELLTEMVRIDNELSTHSQACKEALSEQVMKIRKSKKVQKSYQQY